MSDNDLEQAIEKAIRDTSSADRVADHKIAAGWTLGGVVAVLTILALLGVLPWATRAEVRDLKGDLSERLGRIEASIADIHRVIMKKSD